MQCVFRAADPRDPGTARARITEPKSGVYVFDLGQNFAGLVRLKITGAAGTKVRNCASAKCCTKTDG
jgi:hypothetical protein